MAECPDAPAWILELAVGIWDAPEWMAWERLRGQLAEIGVTPDMLEPIGDPNRPTGVSAAPVEKGWRHGRIAWDADGQKSALLNGIARLLDELER